LTKKREGTLNSYHIDNPKENYHIDDNKGDIKASSIQPIIKEKANKTVKQWLADRLRNRLQRASILSLQTRKPIILYRKDIEESENAVEEEIGYVTGKHIVQLLYSYGGYVPSNFKSIEIFTLDKFARWIVQDQQKDLLLQCIDNLEIK
jgi:hypothetical protein